MEWKRMSTASKAEWEAEAQRIKAKAKREVEKVPDW
jgi:hypothetical protein